MQFLSNVPTFRYFLLFAVLSQLSSIAMGQSIFTATINTTGDSKQLSASDPLFPGYQFEWSVGESAAITTMGEGNLMVTNGLLQYRPQMQTTATSLLASFTTDDIRVYPNPVKNNLAIDILHANKGKLQIELLDSKGTTMKIVQLDYTGMGAQEKWNLSSLPAGQYMVNIRQISPVTGRMVKQGAYRIVKIK